MKTFVPIAAAVVAATAFCTAGGIRIASAVECTGPFRQCAIAVGGVCSIDPNGRQRVTYWDRAGNTIRWETCVSSVFAAAGQPSPYTAGRSGAASLQVPYSELLYPTAPNR